MRRMLTLIAGLALTVPVVAQVAVTTAPSAMPATLQDLVERDTDSALVRAAKRAVRARQQFASQQTARWMVDDSMVAHNTSGKSDKGSGTASRATFNSGTSEGVFSSRERHPVDQAAINKKAGELNREMAQMAAESEEPYGGDVDEDQVDRRMTNIPGEMQSLGREVAPNQPTVVAPTAITPSSGQPH